MPPTKRPISHANKLYFCADLVNPVTYAKRKKISPTLVYQALKSGRIKPDDQYDISGHIHFEWSKYESLTFKEYYLSGNK
jgi:hypothetical protein